MDDIIQRNWTYIERCACCNALQIARATGRYSDIEDFKQEIYLWIVKRASEYSSARAKETTYISMIVETGKRKILRRLRRYKNRMIYDATPI
ncbi:MAG: hypothetical protein E7047_03895 [Lentisphaerae bacterium]|nr:hypothetical protein [Lentisphaerota bacterium]